MVAQARQVLYDAFFPGGGKCMELLTERHAEEIVGVLSCYDRLLIQGTLPGLGYAEGMTAYLKARQIRIFDYPRFAQPLRDALRENAERLAAEHALEIIFIRKKNFRKEDRVKEILAKRGNHPISVNLRIDFSRRRLVSCGHGACGWKPCGRELADSLHVSAKGMEGDGAPHGGVTTGARRPRCRIPIAAVVDACGEWILSGRNRGPSA